MKLQKLTDNVYIADQIELVDLEEFVRLGIKTVINNRPDQELNTPISAEVAEKTKVLALNYYYIPIMPGEYSPENIDTLSNILAESKAPLVAYCRTGNRSTSLWALSQQRKLGISEVIKKANEIGFDIEKCCRA